MLYSILPPVLVVLSLVGIILFLMKRAKRVANLPTEEHFDLDELRTGVQGKRNAKLKAVEQGALVFLESMLKIFRTIFLKIGATLAGFGTQIKKRRSENGTNKNRANSLDTKTAEDDIMNRLKNYSPETKEAAVGSIDRTQDAPMVGEAVIAKKEEKRERKVVAAKIDGKAIKPKMKAEMKDRLEEILIERIALNPKDIEAYERLGEYYMEIENFEFAKECFKQVIKLDPTNKNVKYKMRRLEYVLGR